jgi:hypothetical protein
MLKLIMLSGGTESTAYLFKVLTETTDRVHVHHVTLSNRENRKTAEGKAVKKIISDARKVRDFVFTASAMDCPDGLGIGYTGLDVVKMGFIAGDVCCSIRAAIRMNSNVIEPIEACLAITKTEIGSADAYRKDRRYLGAVQAFGSHFATDTDQPVLSFPLLDTETRDLIKYIPKTLRTSVISCRRPIYVGSEYIGCGLCHTCRKMTAIYKEEKQSA